MKFFSLFKSKCKLKLRNKWVNIFQCSRVKIVCLALVLEKCLKTILILKINNNNKNFLQVKENNKIIKKLLNKLYNYNRMKKMENGRQLLLEETWKMRKQFLKNDTVQIFN